MELTERKSWLGSRAGTTLLALSSSLAAAGSWLAVPHPAVAVAAAAAPLAGLAALRVPFFVCLGFVIFSFFRLHEVFPVLLPLRIPQMLAIATLGVLAWHLFVTRTIRPQGDRLLVLFGVFFAVATLGVALAVNRPAALAYWSGTFIKIAVMVLAIAWMTRRPADFGRATRLFVLAGMVVAAVAVLNKVNGIGLVEGTRVTIGRDIRSLLGDPNDLALVLLFPLGFAAALMLTPGQRWPARVLGAAGALMMLAAIIATQSRGGLLGAVTVMGMLSARVIRSRALLLGLGGLALMILFVLAGVSGRQSGGAMEQGIDESAMGRLHAWNAAFRMALDRPLLGVGLDNFTANYFFYSDFWDGRNHAVHSTWFGVLAETGFLGLVLFITLVVGMLKAAFRAAATMDRLNAPLEARTMGWALTAGLPGLCVSGTFLTQGFTWPLYIELALTVALARFAGGLDHQKKD